MGENEGWAEPGEPLPNGLLPGAGSVMRSLDEDRWVKAEERIAELIACIQPNQLSEERRNAVADYVQRLIMKCFPCQVCTFGSVPLKTYLPDGDIDLTTFSHNQNSKDAWANQVRDMLESEEKNENAEFHVKEVQYIQAEVKLIKCLVENIVVDISFNQIGGLCTLCFLDEVDSLINQNHLFKRSIILIKAWCYYESRILGAHHGLISTYALETLVLYIFHVFNNSFHGPLEVLYRFLEFFSNFDWDNFCLSLWGPVPISSLPNVTAKPPRKDSGELLLSKLFLDACSSVYAVFPGGPENNGQTFVSKHFNVIDPLRVNNNLGRSVSKGNFFRIRSAFAFGAKRLARLLDCPKENLIFEVNQFFMNTWDRHGSGHRPDAPGIDSNRFKLSSLTPDTSHESGTSNNNNNNNNKKSKDPKSRDRPTTSELSEASRTHGLKSQPTANEQIQKDLKSDLSAIDVQGRFLFARTRSSPELTDNYIHKASRGPTKKSPDQDSSGLLDVSNDEFPAPSSSGAKQMMNQEEQDIVNMMASASLGQQVHAPFNLAPGHHLPYSIPPSFLASMGYSQRDFPGFMPTNVPFMDPSFSHMQFPPGFVSPQLTHYFPGMGPNNNPSEDSVDHSHNENFGIVEIKSLDADNNFWKEQDVNNDLENGNFDTSLSVDKAGSKYIPSPKNSREICGAVRENNTLRSRTSSESSWDGSSVKTSKPTKEKRGKKIISMDLTAGKGKIMSEHVSSDKDDDYQEWGPSVVHGSEPVAQTSGSSDSMIPFGPMLINPGARQRTNDNTGLIAFYPTGPPIPFLTMLPVYNYPPESGASDDMLDETKRHDSSGDLSSLGFLRGSTSASEQSEEQQKLDILNSDFSSHWQNLQFGRFCQTSRNQGPLMYPSPVMVPPAYVQGRSQYDNSSRTNTNLYSQLVTSYGHRIVPVAAPHQPVSGRHPNVYQSYADDMPRYRGTGTYLPNHKPSARDRHSSGGRRGNYNHDRNDNSFGDRESNWNANPKSRASSRNNNRSQSDKNSRIDRFTHTEGRSDRSWNSSYRHNSSIPNYQSQNGQLRSNSSSQNGPQNVEYGMYPLGGMNPNGISNGPSGPPVMMLYPFDQNGNTYGSQSEQVEFGSLGQVGFVGTNEQSQLNDGNRARATLEDHKLHGGSGHHSSPEQPSSPRHQRRT